MSRDLLLVLCTLAGATAGWLHAGHISRAVGPPAHPASALGRILLVGAVLLVAAHLGHPLAGAAGWGAALLARGTLLWRRLA